MPTTKNPVPKIGDHGSVGVMLFVESDLPVPLEGLATLWVFASFVNPVNANIRKPAVIKIKPIFFIPETNHLPS